MPLLLMVFVLIAVVVDLIVRNVLRKMHKKKLKEEREQALKVSVQLDFSREAKSLKRVEVEHPKARILCIDDESVVLDSFRKILALDGYSVDTVEKGQEALGLLQSNHFDFVFTDLKMPSMDGVEVGKAIRHIRPDIDVVVVTGFASVETAVECMKHGVMDYIQKPFTEDELLAFVKKLLMIRQDRIHRKLAPKVHISHLQNQQISGRQGEFEIPGGIFIAPGHSWVAIQVNGDGVIGIDDFAKKLLGKIEQIEFPNLSRSIKKGEVLFSVRMGQRKVDFISPLTGQVTKNNVTLLDRLSDLEQTSYDQQWICQMTTEHLDEEIPSLRIGKGAIEVFLKAIETYENILARNVETRGVKDQLYIGGMQDLDDRTWEAMKQAYFSATSFEE